MSAYPKKYISVNEALSILKSAQDSNPENERWYSEVLLFSLKDDSEQSKVKSGPRTKKTNMRIGGQNGCKYLDVKLKYKATYIPFNLTTSNLDSYGNTISLLFCILSICSSGMWIYYSVYNNDTPMIVRSSTEITLLSLSSIYIIRNKWITYKSETQQPSLPSYIQS